MTHIFYHTRLYNDNTVKLVGGSFGGSLDLEMANRLVRSKFTVTVKPSGRTMFVDREGREVHLYVSVDPDMTELGKAAKAKWRLEQREKFEAEQRAEEQYQDLIDELTAHMSNEEVVKRLRMELPKEHQ